MEYIRLQVFCVFVSVFVVLFCVDLAYRVEGDTILRLANIGDNITLSCNRPVINDNYKNWYRNGILIANWEGVFINDPRFTQGVTRNGNPDSNNIYISNIRMNDSATFECCDYHCTEIQSYDLRVIGCSNCITANSDSDKIKVICTLDNYWSSQALTRNIILNRNITRTAVIQGSSFSFSTYVTELNRLYSKFYLQIDTESRITCMLSTQPTSPSYPTTTLSTISLKQTTQNRPSTISYAASKKLTAGRSTSISTTKQHSPTNKNASSNQNKRDGNITLIIAILGSVFSLILILIIIVLRCKHTRDRRENKDTGNASIKKEQPEVRYESVEDGFRKRPGYTTLIKGLGETSFNQRSADHADKKEHPEVRYESVKNGSGKGSEYTTLIKGLRETSLDQRSADHADKKEHPEVCYESVEDGPRQGPGYATSMKELMETNSESKSTSKVGSSNSDYLYSNRAIITQHEQIRCTLQKGDQYDDVKIPGSGDDAEEIPLYEMPDEGPTRNTLKATPEAEQTPTLPKDEVDSVDALYVDVY